tara:strand:+ start:868 stop:1236 length:369 start_codon:yes stop_codon:yes gene_type:complete
MGTSINLPIIEHECNFSKKKSFHFFSLDHKCKKGKCHKESKPTEGQQLSKIPCCSIETSFVNNTELVVLNSELSIVQVAFLSPIYNLVDESLNFKKRKEFVPSEHKKRYGYRYRIALQSFLC